MVHHNYALLRDTLVLQQQRTATSQVEDAKDLAQIVRDVTRYGGAYRPEVCIISELRHYQY